MIVRLVDIPVVATNDEKLTGSCGTAGSGVLGCQLTSGSLIDEPGWEWRCNVDAAKLQSMADYYEEIGFEVLRNPLNLSGLSDHCLGCREALATSFALFVRRKQ